MAAVTARQADQQLYKLLQRAERGEKLTSAERGKAVAKLVPATPPQGLAAADEQERRREVTPWSRSGVPRGGRVVERPRDES